MFISYMDTVLLYSVFTVTKATGAYKITGKITKTDGIQITLKWLNLVVFKASLIVQMMYISQSEMIENWVLYSIQLNFQKNDRISSVSKW